VLLFYDSSDFLPYFLSGLSILIKKIPKKEDVLAVEFGYKTALFLSRCKEVEVELPETTYKSKLLLLYLLLPIEEFLETPLLLGVDSLLLLNMLIEFYF
jgi:hypothetical protein